MLALVQYKGYDIVESSGGGKAGKGQNKTASIQVRKDAGGGGYMLKKQIRYTVHDPASKAKALSKAIKFIDKIK